MPPDFPNPSPTQEVQRFEVSEPYHRAAQDGKWVRYEDHQRLLQAEVEKREEVEDHAGDLEAASIQRGDRVIELERRLVNLRRGKEAAESKLSSVVEELEELAATKLMRRDCTAASNETGLRTRARLMGEALGHRAAAQLLRDKGTEQGGGDSGVGAGNEYGAAQSPRSHGVGAAGVDSGVAIEGDPRPSDSGVGGTSDQSGKR